MRRLSRLSLFLAVLGLLLFPSLTRAQSDLGDVLNNIGQSYADKYAQPITNALGGGLNAGLFRTADFGGTGLFPLVDVYVGVSAMGTFTSSSTFQPENESIEFETKNFGTVTGTIQYPSEVPNVFGKSEQPPDAEIIYDDSGIPKNIPNEKIPLPPGLVNTSIAPLAVPQVGVGTVFGTDAQFRYLPEQNIGSYGSVGVTGISVRHSLSQYIPLSPVAIAVQGTWQSLNVSSQAQDDILTASGWALNAQVSKSIPIVGITAYGGLQYESFGVDVNYSFETDVGGEQVTKTISLSQQAENKFRALAGVSFSFLVLRINADYAIGSNNNVATVGVGLIL